PRPSHSTARRYAMHRPSLSLAALGLLAGCSKPGPQQQQAAAPAGVQWAVVVLYNHPKDTAAFEKYYKETHVPLFASHAQEIGVTRAELIKFASTADGKPPTLYREADLRFDSKEALEKGTATPGFKAVAADLANFATGREGAGTPTNSAARWPRGGTRGGCCRTKDWCRVSA